MNLNKKTIGIQTMVLIGFALTIKLAMIYYSANYDKYALSSFCSVNEFIDCDGIAKTSTAQFWGIPLAYWGMFFYITIFNLFKIPLSISLIANPFFPASLIEAPTK